MRQRPAGRAPRGTDTDADFVLRNSRGNPLRASGPNDLLRVAFEKSGIPGDRPVFHHLRHSCGSGLADVDTPGYVIQDILGHEDEKMIRTYVKRTARATQREWMARRASGTTVRLAPVVPLPATTEIHPSGEDRQVG